MTSDLELVPTNDIPNLAPAIATAVVASTPVAEATSQITFDSMDANRDGKVSALDALMVINYLNRTQYADGERASGTADTDTAQVYDLNLDGRVSAVDALMVINAMNRAEHIRRFGGCSCGGLGCPACSASTEQSFPDLIGGPPSEQAVTYEEVVSDFSFPSGGCSCGGLGCAACSAGSS